MMFTLSMYSFELFINLSLPMTNYTRWELKTALSVQYVVKVSIAMFICLARCSIMDSTTGI